MRGPDDVIFVNFVGHGGLGVLGLPQDDIFANDFVKSIDFMKEKSKYSKLIIYIESSLSDSIFGDLLLGTKNVFVLTSTHPLGDSQAAFYDEVRKTYLSNVFSFAWMDDIEYESVPNKNLRQRHGIALSYTSCVEKYSDLDISETKLKDILEYQRRLMVEKNGFNLPSVNMTSKHPHILMDTADNIDVSYAILQNQLIITENSEERINLEFKINDLENKRKFVDQTFDKLIGIAADYMSKRKNELEESKYSLSRNNSLCYKKLYTTFSDSHVRFHQNPYARTQLQKLLNMCSVNWLKIEEVLHIMLYSWSKWLPTHSQFYRQIQNDLEEINCDAREVVTLEPNPSRDYKPTQILQPSTDGTEPTDFKSDRLPSINKPIIVSTTCRNYNRRTKDAEDHMPTQASIDYTSTPYPIDSTSTSELHQIPFIPTRCKTTLFNTTEHPTERSTILPNTFSTAEISIESTIITTTSTKAPIITTTSTEAPIRRTTSTEAPIITTTSIEGPIGRATSTEAPIITIASTEASIITTTSTEAPIITITSTEVPIITKTSSIDMNNCSISGNNKSFPCLKLKKISLKYCSTDLPLDDPRKGTWTYTCYRETMRLECDNKEQIYIHEAKWGRFDKTRCRYFPDQPRNCSTVDDTYFRIRERCYGKRKCTFFVHYNDLSNPCPSYNKYLSVRWSCLPVDPLIRKHHLCNGDSGNLSCSKGKVLFIHSAFWGNEGHNICRQKSSGLNCSSDKAIDILSGR